MTSLVNSLIKVKNFDAFGLLKTVEKFGEQQESTCDISMIQRQVYKQPSGTIKQKMYK